MAPGRGEIMGTLGVDLARHGALVSRRRRRRVVCGLGGMGRFQVGPAAVSVSGEAITYGTVGGVDLVPIRST